MRALRLIADRKLELAEVPDPPPPRRGEVQVRIKAVALNHLDLWGFRGMAFAKRKMPLVVGAEASGEIAAVGAGVTGFKPGDKVVMYGAHDLRQVPGLPRGPRQSVRERRRHHGLSHRRLRPRSGQPAGAAGDPGARPACQLRDAACAPIAFGTVEHMLFDNAKLKPGETILVHAGGSGIGSVAIKMAKAIGCTVITTVGDDAKAEKAKALGADHVINYKTERFEGVTRKLTAKKGVDVVFEHVGGEGFNGSLLCLKRGGRLVTCGSTAGPTVTINLMQLFQQQYKIFGSFGASMRNIRDSLAKMAAGMAPVIDTRIRARRFRTRPGAAGKPAGVRQSHREVLMQAPHARSAPPLAPTRKRAGNAVAAARSRSACSGCCACSIPTDMRRFRRLADAQDRPAGCRNTRSAAPISPPPFRKNRRPRSTTILRGVWDNLGRVGAEFAHLDRLWDCDPAHPDRIGRIDHHARAPSSAT